MPRDFKSFVKNNQPKENINSNQDTSKYEEILNKYKNMNQNELMSNLFNEAIKLKKEGKLDSNTLNSLKSTISPFLNETQREMLDSLINTINTQVYLYSFIYKLIILCYNKYMIELKNI